jgi:hypothetical protein
MSCRLQRLQLTSAGRRISLCSDCPNRLLADIVHVPQRNALGIPESNNVTVVPASRMVVRPLTEADLAEASRIGSVAFGTFLGAADPETFLADCDFVYGRWGADHTAALGAQLDGVLVGSNFATNWGSVGFFGPLTPSDRIFGIGESVNSW